MARLPVPGGDEGSWGDVLNQFLLTSHLSSGELRNGVVSTGKIATGAVTNDRIANDTIAEVKLDAGVRAKLNASGGGGGDPAMGGDLSGTASNAQLVASAVDTTELANGAVTDAKVAATAAIAQSKIANLTADLAAKASSTHGHVIADVTNLQAALDAKVDDSEKGAASGVATLDGAIKVPVAQLPDGTTSAKGVIRLAGDLAGTATAPTVPGLATKISSSEKGQPDGVAQLDGSGKVNPGQLQTSNITKVLPYSYTGTLAVGPGTFRLYNDMGSTWTITGVRASVGTAPAGASVIIDINKNGSSIFTTQANRPTVAAATNTSGNVTNMDVTTVAAGEYLTVDIDQIGSITAGADLTVQVGVV